MDCFLLEGIKFIFRASLGILRLNQGHILRQGDPFVLFQYIKELAKHIFDMETLFQVLHMHNYVVIVVIVIIVSVVVGVYKVGSFS